MDNQFNPKIDYWKEAFRAFLDLPNEGKAVFNFGTFTPEKIPSLTVQFIEEQSLKYPALNIPIFEDYKGWFTTPPKPPTPPSKTEISQKADKKYFGHEPDRELWKAWRYDWEMENHEKELALFEQATNQHKYFVRMHKKTETDYLNYLKTHYPPVQRFLSTTFQRTLNFEDRFKHSYITGNTGSGKSELIKYLVYPLLIEQNPSSAVVVVDPNGDMALEIAQFKEFYQNDRLVYFDPFLNTNKVPVINPFFMGV